MDGQETLNMINTLSKNLDGLLNTVDQTLRSLPNDVRKSINFTKLDMESIKDAVANGDLSKLDELTKRYAGTNTER